MRTGKAGIKSFLAGVAILSLALTGSSPTSWAGEKTQIEFWYALSGQIAEVTLDMVNQFNRENTDVVVKAVNKGTYAETLTSAIAAYRAGRAPHVIQVYEVGTQTLLDSKAVVPAYQLFEDQKIPMNWDDIIAPVRTYYSVKGKLWSLPFNSSTPILYFNKNAFKKAGLDPAKPAKTFKDIEEMGRKLVGSGAAEYVLTAGWPSWTLIENMHTWHSQPITNHNNGYADHATELLINREFGKKLFETYTRWQKDKIFSYEGREGQPNPSFLGGKIAMIITSTAYLGGFTKAATFEIGTTFLPMMEGYERGNSLVGGATLWTLKGHTKKEYQAAAKFLKFVGSTPQQVSWHKRTGYFPITNAAVAVLKGEGWFEKNPNHLTAFQQMGSGKITPQSQGLRLGNFVAIRQALEKEMENIFKGSKNPQKGLDDAVRESNEILKEYVSMYRK